MTLRRAMLQKNPNGLQVVQEAGKRKLQLFTANDVSDGPELKVNTVQVRINIDGDRAIYSYSLDDGRSFHQLGNDISITFSFWKGSRPPPTCR